MRTLTELTSTEIDADLVIDLGEMVHEAYATTGDGAGEMLAMIGFDYGQATMHAVVEDVAEGYDIPAESLYTMRDYWVRTRGREAYRAWAGMSA